MTSLFYLDKCKTSGSAVISGNAVPLGADRARFYLHVQDAGKAAGDTLDVRLQRSCQTQWDLSWDDFVAFTTVPGNGRSKQYVVDWSSFAPPESEMRLLSDGLLAPGTVIQGGPFAEQIRVHWTVAGATPEFTFCLAMETARIGRGW